jgi:fermentation-respiration switch protein FrsA (DUF1100 family)
MLRGAILFALAVGLSVAAAFAQSPLGGIWEGVLSLPNGVNLRLVIKVTEGEKGTLKGTLDSPDQGAADIPLDLVELKGNSVLIRLKALAIEYTGTLNDAGGAMLGKFKQSGLELDLELKKVDKPTERRRPQNPTAPFPYRAEDVKFENAAAKVTLAGTLTLPAGDGPFPAAILVSGSGPQDRDETLMGHKPFLVIADYLTRMGVAVLRYDDRGTAGSTGDFASATSADLATDAASALDFLKARKEIDAAKIGIIGHSEGGLIAPIVASSREDVAFIVLLAGTGVNGAEIIKRQGELILRDAGADDKLVDRARAMNEQFFAVVRENPDPKKAEELLRKLATEMFASLSEEERALVGDAEAAVQQALVVNTPWMRYFLTFDPADALSKVKAPVLALNGTLDLQVEYRQNLPAIAAALARGVNQNFTIVALPGLNHLFQACETGSPMRYAIIEETINPSALEAMGGWLRTILRLRP